MRNSLAKVVRLSALVGAGGALSFAVFFSNCGGDGRHAHWRGRVDGRRRGGHERHAAPPARRA